MGLRVENIDSVSHTWGGILIAAEEGVDLIGAEGATFTGDSVFIADLIANKAQVKADGVVLTDDADALDRLRGAPQRFPEDSDKSPIIRSKTTKAGWHYEPRFIEFWSSKYASLHNKKVGGTDYTDGVLKFWKANGDQLVIGGEESNEDFQVRLDTDCVKTTMDWQPAYDMDIRAGRFLMGVKPTTPTYAFAVVAPDIPEIYGGSVPHVSGGAPLHLMADYSVIEFEGVTVKNVLYDPVYNSNKFRIIIEHNAGVKINMAIAFEHYKA